MFLDKSAAGLQKKRRVARGSPLLICVSFNRRKRCHLHGEESLLPYLPAGRKSHGGWLERKTGDFPLAVENGALDQALLLEGEHEFDRLKALELTLPALVGALQGTEVAAQLDPHDLCHLGSGGAGGCVS